MKIFGILNNQEQSFMLWYEFENLGHDYEDYENQGWYLAELLTLTNHLTRSCLDFRNL